MATKHLRNYQKSSLARPGARAARAKKYALRLVLAIIVVFAITFALMFLKLDIPGLDVPGMAWR